MKRGPLHYLECISCHNQFRPTQIYSCPNCGDLLQINYKYEPVSQKFKRSLDTRGPLSVWRYRELLPVPARNAVTLGEGGTALPKSTRLRVS